MSDALPRRACATLRAGRRASPARARTPPADPASCRRAPRGRCRSASARRRGACAPGRAGADRSSAARRPSRGAAPRARPAARRPRRRAAARARRSRRSAAPSSAAARCRARSRARCAPTGSPCWTVEYERVAARQNTSDVTRRSSACGVDGSRKPTNSRCASATPIGSCARTTNTTATVSASAASIAVANPSSRQNRRRWSASTCCRPLEPHEHRRRRRRLHRPARRVRLHVSGVGVGVVVVRASSLVASGDTIRPARLGRGQAISGGMTSGAGGRQRGGEPTGEPDGVTRASADPDWGGVGRCMEEVRRRSG